MVEVECRFTNEGRVEVLRVRLDGDNDRWLAVKQGRQWLDNAGLHILIMVPALPAQELNLRPDTMTWQMRPAGTPGRQLV